MSLDLSVLGEPVEVRRPLVRLLRRGKDEANLLQILDLVVGHGGLRSLLPVAVLLPLYFDPPAELLVLVVHSWHEAVAVSFLVGLELLQALGPGVDPPLSLLLRGAGATLAGGGFGGAAGPCGFGSLLDNEPLEAIFWSKRESKNTEGALGIRNKMQKGEVEGNNERLAPKTNKQTGNNT